MRHHRITACNKYPDCWLSRDRRDESGARVHKDRRPLLRQQHRYSRGKIALLRPVLHATPIAISANANDAPFTSALVPASLAAATTALANAGAAAALAASAASITSHRAGPSTSTLPTSARAVTTATAS